MSVRPDIWPEPQLISVGKFCQFLTVNNIPCGDRNGIISMNFVTVDAYVQSFFKLFGFFSNLDSDESYVNSAVSALNLSSYIVCTLGIKCNRVT